MYRSSPTWALKQPPPPHARKPAPSVQNAHKHQISTGEYVWKNARGRGFGRINNNNNNNSNSNSNSSSNNNNMHSKRNNNNNNNNKIHSKRNNNKIHSRHSGQHHQHNAPHHQLFHHHNDRHKHKHILDQSLETWQKTWAKVGNDYTIVAWYNIGHLYFEGYCKHISKKDNFTNRKDIYCHGDIWANGPC